MEFISDYLLFLLKVGTCTAAFLAVFAMAKLSSNSSSEKGELSVRSLNDEHSDSIETLEEFVLGEGELKESNKTRKAASKEIAKQQRKPQTFVLDFVGGIGAEEVASLREEITSVLSVARHGDEVLLRLESGGGLVSAYGLAAAQLERLKSADIKLVVSVDKVAASGGYMMACVADKIIATPFATLGSVGVVAQFPNFHKVLKKNEIDFEQVTAGQYKRTMTMFGENTDEARQKFELELDNTHDLFIAHVEKYRPALENEDFGTGECWYGSESLEIGLVDELNTSDDYILSAIKSRNVLHVSYNFKKTLSQKISGASASIVESLMTKAFQKGQSPLK